MTQFDSIQDVLHNAISNGGGTFAIETHHNKRFVTDAGFKSGYYVATQGNEHVVTGSEFDHFTIEWFIAKHLSLLTNTRDGKDYLLGIWESDGYWYLDISEFVSNYSEAIRLGRERNQLAVWDIADNDELVIWENLPAECN